MYCTCVYLGIKLGDFSQNTVFLNLADFKFGDSVPQPKIGVAGFNIGFFKNSRLPYSANFSRYTVCLRNVHACTCIYTCVQCIK